VGALLLLSAVDPVSSFRAPVFGAHSRLLMGDKVQQPQKHLLQPLSHSSSSSVAEADEVEELKDALLAEFIVLKTELTAETAEARAEAKEALAEAKESRAEAKESRAEAKEH
jgi:hypothetical protein